MWTAESVTMLATLARSCDREVRDVIGRVS